MSPAEKIGVYPANALQGYFMHRPVVNFRQLKRIAKLMGHTDPAVFLIGAIPARCRMMGIFCRAGN